MFDGAKIRDFVGAIQKECIDVLLPPEAGIDFIGQPVISFSIVRGTRGYIERITHQINMAYANGCYDACAVMIRRLLETLIIEVFEAMNLTSKIKNPQDDYCFLSDLITHTLAESSFGLSRNTKKALPHLKDVGDKSAHSRRYNAMRSDIDKITKDVRLVVQELIYLAKLK